MTTLASNPVRARRLAPLAGKPSQTGGAAAKVGASLAECLLVGLLVGLAVGLLMPGPFGPGSYGDDGVYVALGRSLADGVGYRSLYAVGTPYHVKFPPLYPALLAIFWRLDGNVFEVVRLARIANAAFLGLAAALLWPIGRNRLGIGRAPLAAFVLGPLFLDASLHYFALPLTEPLFILLWAIALVLGDRLSEERGTRAPLAFGAVLAAAALTRAQGLALIAAAPFALAARRVRRRRSLVAIAAATLPVIAWQVVRTAWIRTGASAGAEGSYLLEVMGGGARAALRSLEGSALFNLRGYPGLLAPYLAPDIWGRVAIGLLIALTLIGLFRLARRAPFLVVSVTLQVALIVVWPFTVDRLALTILPFAGLIAAYRLDVDLRRLPARLRPLATGALLAVAGFIGARQVWIRHAEAGQGDPGFYTPARLISGVSRDTRLISSWVEQNTDSSDVVYVSWPEGVYLRTGRLTVNADPAQSRTGGTVHGEPAPTFAGSLLAKRVSVVVASSASYASTHDVEGLLESCPGFLRRVATLDTTGYPAVYRVARKEASCGENLRSLDPASGR